MKTEIAAKAGRMTETGQEKTGRITEIVLTGDRTDKRNPLTAGAVTHKAVKIKRQETVMLADVLPKTERITVTTLTGNTAATIVITVIAAIVTAAIKTAAKIKTTISAIL